MIKKSITVVLITCVVVIGIFFGYKQLKTYEIKQFIKDEYNNKKIIEYFNIDTNELRLKITEDNNFRWIKHPNCCTEYYEHIPTNTIKFDHVSENLLIVNGKTFVIEDE